MTASQQLLLMAVSRVIGSGHLASYSSIRAGCSLTFGLSDAAETDQKSCLIGCGKSAVDASQCFLSTLSGLPDVRSEAVIQPGCKCHGSMPHVSRMPEFMQFHQHSHPLHISLVGAQAIVFVTNSLTNLVNQTCGAQYMRGG